VVCGHRVCFFVDFERSSEGSHGGRLTSGRHAHQRGLVVHHVRGLNHPTVQLALVEQHVAGPAVLGGSGGTPVTFGLCGEPVEQDCEMASGQLGQQLVGQLPCVARAIWRMYFRLIR